MDLSNEKLERGRYRCEAGKTVIDIAVDTARQIFNERDPAPFRERDLDENFVTYVLSSVQEFPLKTEMKLEIFVRNESDATATNTVIREAIRGYFTYESRLASAKIRKRLKTSRWFFLIGLLCLFACLSIARLLGSIASYSKLLAIAREGFVIIGWVAMWRPIEVLLYDWWPLREQRLYFEKIAAMNVEVRCGDSLKSL